MNQNTKQRVVGTVVLLALALIILPVILDGDGSYQMELSSRIPEPPVIQLLPDPIPQRPVIQADAFPEPVDEPVAAPEQATTVVVDSTPDFDAAAGTQAENPQPVAVTENTRPAALALDDAGLPTGWSVRLGTFSNANNASNLVGRLVGAGYQAYARDSMSQQGEMTAVFVGPQLEKEKAEELRRRLQEEFQLSGVVVQYRLDDL